VGPGPATRPRKECPQHPVQGFRLPEGPQKRQLLHCQQEEGGLVGRTAARIFKRNYLNKGLKSHPLVLSVLVAGLIVALLTSIMTNPDMSIGFQLIATVFVMKK